MANNISTTNDEFVFFRFITSPKYKKFVKKHFAKYVNPELFINLHIRKAVERLQHLYIERDILLSFKELVRDTTLSEETKNFLKKKERIRKQLALQDETLEIPKSKKELESLFNYLKFISVYKKLVDISNEISEKLRNITPSSLDEETIKNLQLEILEKINSTPTLSGDGKLYSLTKESAKDEIRGLRNKLKNRWFIPTGFKGFDNINIGIPRDSLFLIGAKTGCGKSSMVLQLAMNMKTQGASVCIVPLEMSVDQILLRMASNRLRITVNDLVANYDFYEKRIIKALTPFILDEKNSSRFDIYIPEPEETIEDILNCLKPNNYDIIFIDLINLVAPIRSENESQALNKAGRFAKVFATSNETVVCLVAQLDEEKHKIRYSRALTEHASNSWFWFENVDDIMSNGGIVKVIQRKARNQSPAPFWLKVELKYYRFEDYDFKNDENGDYVSTRKKAGSKKRYKDFDPNKFDEMPEPSLEEIPTDDEE